MTTLALTCRNCGAAQDVRLRSTQVETTCSSCEHRTTVEAFPALWQLPQEAAAGERLLVDDDSACFYHAEKKAAIVCEECGRFLCALCDTPFEGRHLCPTCVERRIEKPREGAVQSSYTYHDSIALALAVLSFVPFFWYLSLFLAPVSLYIAVRYWRTPLSATPRGRWRIVAAAILSIAALVMWTTLFGSIIGFFMTSVTGDG
jgi:hypothetical protein